MADEITPKQAWEMLRLDPGAQLVDVRTEAEWQHVGLPDLAQAGKRVHLVSWQHPSGALNRDFLAQLRREAGLVQDQTLLFLCRSGVRSLAAADAASEAGFAACLNVAHGFEGPPDARGRRGTLAGWQADGLPWAR